MSELVTLLSSAVPLAAARSSFVAEYHDGWCALKSPSIMVLSELLLKRLSKLVWYPAGHEVHGGR